MHSQTLTLNLKLYSVLLYQVKDRYLTANAQDIGGRGIVGGQEPSAVPVDAS